MSRNMLLILRLVNNLLISLNCRPFFLLYNVTPTFCIFSLLIVNHRFTTIYFFFLFYLLYKQMHLFYYCRLQQTNSVYRLYLDTIILHKFIISLLSSLRPYIVIQCRHGNTPMWLCMLSVIRIFNGFNQKYYSFEGFTSLQYNLG